MKSKLETIHHTKEFISRLGREIGQIPLNWNAFQKHFSGKKNIYYVSARYKAAKALAWLKENYPDAAKKGYLIQDGEARPIWLSSCQNHWIAESRTLGQIDLYDEVGDN